MKKILNTIWVMGVLTLAVFCLSACDRDLDVQQSYPFTVETMPVQKDIIRGRRLRYAARSNEVVSLPTLAIRYVISSLMARVC